MDLVERLFFDVEATRDVMNWWRGSVETQNLLSNGSIRSIFVGTAAGLTRFWRLDPDRSVADENLIYVTIVQA